MPCHVKQCLASGFPFIFLLFYSFILFLVCAANTEDFIFPF